MPVVLGMTNYVCVGERLRCHGYFLGLVKSTTDLVFAMVRAFNEDTGYMFGACV